MPLDHTKQPLKRLRRPASRRAGTLSAALAALMVVLPGAATAQDTLNVATWGGAYGKSQEAALFGPFVKERGVAVSSVHYDGNLAKLKDMIGGRTSSVDVVDVSAGGLAALCDAGLLEKIDIKSLAPAPGGGGIEEDFFAGSLSPCGVPSVAWSLAIAFDRRDFKGGAPTDINALLDVKRYPGLRALPKKPQYTLELAMLASGVPAENVYSELATAEGADRAFEALNKITNAVVLWGSAAEPVAWLAKGRVSMAAGYSGRLFRAAAGDRQIGILWDGQIYDIDAWAIPKSSRRKDKAQRFVRFATAPEQLAAQARLIGYGPMRKSALPLVGKHPILKVDMQDFLPTAPQNFAKALKFDEGWWDKNGAALRERYAAWEAKVEAAEQAREDARKAKEAAEEASATP